MRTLSKHWVFCIKGELCLHVASLICALANHMFVVYCVFGVAMFPITKIKAIMAIKFRSQCIRETIHIPSLVR